MRTGYEIQVPDSVTRLIDVAELLRVDLHKDQSSSTRYSRDSMSSESKESAPIASNSAPPLSPVHKRYLVKFEGNGSKHWDGKQIELEGGVAGEFICSGGTGGGKEADTSMAGKGSTTDWSVVVIDPGEASEEINC